MPLVFIEETSSRTIFGAKFYTLTPSLEGSEGFEGSEGSETSEGSDSIVHVVQLFSTSLSLALPVVDFFSFSP